MRVAVICGLLVPAVLSAQETATITGRVVHKTTKAGIPGADVMLAPENSRLVTDSSGFFTFDRVQPGTVGLLVRRLGFAPESASFAVGRREDLDVLIEMQEAPQELDTVNVAARSEPLVRGKLSAYVERKRVGIGKFIDGEILKQEQQRQLGDLIAYLTPGSRLIRAKMGSMAWIATTRDFGARPTGVTLDDIDRRLGADPRACYPDIYIDGVNVYSFGSAARLFDINSIGTAEVSAIEVYVGAARIPTQYNRASSACGVVLIWTK